MRERWYGRSVARRLPRLVAGLLMFGVAIGLLVRSDLGMSPWETLHQGISERTGVSIGLVSIVLGVPILLAWIPLRVQPGIGTVLNVIIIGLVTDLTLAQVPEASWLPVQLALMAGGIGLIALATGLYLATDLGPGPRDGLFTGVHRRFGWRIAWIRAVMEGGLLVVGFLLGGTVGLGTVAFALAIGPLTELSLHVFDREGRVMHRRREDRGAARQRVPA